MSNNKITLTPEQADAFGRELDVIKERVMADLCEKDADYIRRVIKVQRTLEVGGRALLFLPPAWPLGTAMLGLSKIMDNMEIGHNIMHGQYDWMRDPAISGRSFEWDTACPADQWRHSHNYMHHTHTNIVGMDRDIGYGILRMSEDQPWEPYFLGNPVYAFLLMVLFQYGVALHELETERIRSGEIRLRDKREVLRAIWKKTRRQTLKDYVAFPLLAGPFAPFVFTGNVTANLMRNVWSYMIIFCGHFPDGTQEFTVEETKDEPRGMWYFRQVLGSANLTGGKIFHLLSGNLSHQIEHHLFPDMPARRYAEIASEVREICERYGVPYNNGPLMRQFGTVVRKIVKLTFPESWPPRRTPRVSRSIESPPPRNWHVSPGSGWGTMGPWNGPAPATRTSRQWKRRHGSTPIRPGSGVWSAISS
jgi:fatty acid desaturase